MFHWRRENSELDSASQEEKVIGKKILDMHQFNSIIIYLWDYRFTNRSVSLELLLEHYRAEALNSALMHA